MGGMQSTLTCACILPESWCISPSMADNKEDLPAPTDPIMATREPLGTLKFILKTINSSCRTTQ